MEEGMSIRTGVLSKQLILSASTLTYEQIFEASSNTRSNLSYFQVCYNTTQHSFKMHFTSLLTPLLFLSTALVHASPVSPEASPSTNLIQRQAALPKPPPCIRNFKTSAFQTKKRAQKFAKAFIYDQDITKAFTFIAEDYIVRALFRVCCIESHRIASRRISITNISCDFRLNAGISVDMARAFLPFYLPHFFHINLPPLLHILTSSAEPQPVRAQRLRLRLVHPIPHLGEPDADVATHSLRLRRQRRELAELGCVCECGVWADCGSVSLGGRVCC